MLNCVFTKTCELIAICPDCDFIDIDDFMTTGDNPLTLLQSDKNSDIRAIGFDEVIWLVQTKPTSETWIKRPHWHCRQTVLDLAERHGIDHDTAAEMYKQRGE